MKKCLALVFLVYSSITALQTYSGTDAKGRPLDHKLIKRMHISNGIFIEVGASDGVTQSNTCLLERNFGWTGILVEPSPIAYEQACTNRPNSHCFQCALGSFAEDGSSVCGDFNGALMSSVNGKRLFSPLSISVPIRSLQSILDEMAISHVNFFSLDTEGYEYNILQGIDFEKTSFDYILIEIYNWDYNSIVSFLANRGYQLIKCLSGYNHHDNPYWDGTHNHYLFVNNLLSK